MNHLEYIFVDVFTDKTYAGNQLAVVFLKEEIDTNKMQKITREFNFSETTFIDMRHSTPDRISMRIFTPGQEIPFAGHPMLGSAFVVKKFLFTNQDLNHVNFHLPFKDNYLKVELEKDRDDNLESPLLWLTQKEPVFGQKYFYDEVAAMIGVPNIEVCGRIPVQEVDTGMKFLLIPIKRRNTVEKAKIVIEEYEKFFAEKDEKLPLLIFSGEPVEEGNHLHARMFAPAFGVPEDPATGSAAGCLSAYCLQYDVLKKGILEKLDIRLEQGYEMGRPSLLYLRGQREEDRIFNIQVGGRVQIVAKGQIFD